MSETKYELEERLLEYSVRIIRADKNICFKYKDSEI